MLGEGILYGHVVSLARGEQLYRPVDQAPYTIANYTPLYYVTGSALHALAGGGFLPGRLLSLASGLTAAGLVAYLTTRLARDFRAAVLASCLFLALGIAGRTSAAPPWIALYKEDALGVALSLAAIAVLGSRVERRHIVLAGALGGLALLTKQTFIAALLAGFMWLAWRNWRHAALFALGSAAMVLPVATFFEVTSRSFFANAVFSNASPLSVDALTFGFRRFAWAQLGPVAVAGIFVMSGAIRGRFGRPEALLILYWCASALPVLGIAMVGSNYNYWMEFAAITSVLASLGLWRDYRVARDKRSTVTAQPRLARLADIAPAALLAAFVAAVTPSTVVGTVQGITAMQSNRRGAGEFAAIVQRVADEPGGVLTDPADVSTLAERRTLLEPFVFTILYQQGRWDPSPVIDLICTRRVTLLVLNRPLDEFEQIAFHGYTYWPQPVVAALRQMFTFQTRDGPRFLYVPRVSPTQVSAQAENACSLSGAGGTAKSPPAS